MVSKVVGKKVTGFEGKGGGAVTANGARRRAWPLSTDTFLLGDLLTY